MKPKFFLKPPRSNRFHLINGWDLSPWPSQLNSSDISKSSNKYHHVQNQFAYGPTLSPTLPRPFCYFPPKSLFSFSLPICTLKPYFLPSLSLHRSLSLSLSLQIPCNKPKAFHLWRRRRPEEVTPMEAAAAEEEEGREASIPRPRGRLMGAPARRRTLAPRPCETLAPPTAGCRSSSSIPPPNSSPPAPTSSSPRPSSASDSPPLLRRHISHHLQVQIHVHIYICRYSYTSTRTVCRLLFFELHSGFCFTVLL